MGLIEAAGTALIAALVYVRPQGHTAAGVAMISLAMLSLFSGGGLLIGAFAAWVGGVLAVIYRPAPWVQGAEGLSRVDIEDDPVIEADLADAGMLPSGRP